MTEPNFLALVEELLAHNSGAQFISLTYLRPYKIQAAYKKEGVEGYAEQTWSGLILGGDYKGKCNTAAERSGSTEQMEVAKGHLTRLTTFVYENNGIHRLLAQITKAAHCDSTYFLNGKECTKEELAAYAIKSEFAPKPKLTGNQAAAGITEENAVVVREFRLDRIKSIKFNGKLYD